MKLRIRGNSVRIRVAKIELAEIADAGAAEDSVGFSPSTELRYRLRPEEVSVEGRQAIGDGATPRMLIEKDYTCLAPCGGEDDSDLFASPRKKPGARDD